MAWMSFTFWGLSSFPSEYRIQASLRRNQRCHTASAWHVVASTPDENRYMNIPLNRPGNLGGRSA
jgi:hypothetical protein